MPNWADFAHFHASTRDRIDRSETPQRACKPR